MKSSPRETRVLIIGAGAAGLGAARELRNARIPFRILEARDRIGGRAHTVRSRGKEAGARFPVELGPEFIHGSPEDALALYASLGARAFEITGKHYSREGAGFGDDPDFFERMGNHARKFRVPAGDLSFSTALARVRGIPASERASLRAFAQGFNAAITSDSSAFDTIAAMKAIAEAENYRTERLFEGYGPLLEKMAARFLDRVSFGREVVGIRWSRGSVEVECVPAGRRASATDREIHRASRVLITVPIGNLRGPDAIRFEPPVPSIARAAEKLAMGPVVKVMLEFESDLWAKRFPPETSMLHDPELRFHTWWTSHPLHWPVITAWSGGDPAERLRHLDTPALERIAIEELAELTGLSTRRLRAAHRRTHYHDWCGDPYARGAYAYVRPGGAGARRELARTVRGTIFVAGEATSEEENGTVNGALFSGIAAARRIARAVIAEADRSTRRNGGRSGSVRNDLDPGPRTRTVSVTARDLRSHQKS